MQVYKHALPEEINDNCDQKIRLIKNFVDVVQKTTFCVAYLKGEKTEISEIVLHIKTCTSYRSLHIKHFLVSFNLITKNLFLTITKF